MCAHFCPQSLLFALNCCSCPRTGDRLVAAYSCVCESIVARVGGNFREGPCDGDAISSGFGASTNVSRGMMMTHSTQDHWAQWLLHRRFGGNQRQLKTTLESLSKSRDPGLGR